MFSKAISSPGFSVCSPTKPWESPLDVRGVWLNPRNEPPPQNWSKWGGDSFNPIFLGGDVIIQSWIQPQACVYTNIFCQCVKNESLQWINLNSSRPVVKQLLFGSCFSCSLRILSLLCRRLKMAGFHSALIFTHQPIDGHPITRVRVPWDLLRFRANVTAGAAALQNFWSHEQKKPRRFPSSGKTHWKTGWFIMEFPSLILRTIPTSQGKDFIWITLLKHLRWVDFGCSCYSSNRNEPGF